MSPDASTVLVTGASGWIGRATCTWLRSTGVRVVAVLRRPADGPWDDACICDVAGFEKPSEEAIRHLGACDAVIHCAGHVHRPLETAAERADFHAVNAMGTHAVAQASVRYGNGRVVYTSTIAGYDWRSIAASGAVEDGPADPGSIYAATKLQGEQAIRDAGGDWRIARLATVFGVGDRANFARMASAISRRRFLIPGKGTARKSVLPLTLAAEILGRLALIEEPRHRLMNAALPVAPSLGELCDAFGTVCGLPRVPRIPAKLLWMASRGGDVLAASGRGTALTSGTFHRLTVTTAVQTERLRETFPGMRFPTFAEALAEYRDFYRSL